MILLSRFANGMWEQLVDPTEAVPNRSYVYDCLDSLERDGLIESDFKYVGEFPEGDMRYSFWRVSQKEIQS